jgi:hypothetical protein
MLLGRGDSARVITCHHHPGSRKGHDPDWPHWGAARHQIWAWEVGFCNLDPAQEDTVMVCVRESEHVPSLDFVVVLLECHRLTDWVFFHPSIGGTCAPRNVRDHFGATVRSPSKKRTMESALPHAQRIRQKISEYILSCFYDSWKGGTVYLHLWTPRSLHQHSLLVWIGHP